MTYVEFFAKTSIENISACLADAAQRVVLVGDDFQLMEYYAKRYEKLFFHRGYKVEFVCKTVNKNKLESIIDALSEIAESCNDCIFDLNGGDELFILAMGIVCERYKEKNIKVHRFNIKNNTVIYFDKEGKTIQKKCPQLSVKENVSIYGGNASGVDGKWDCNDDFLKDIEKIWQICRQNVRLWNSQISVFEAAEKLKYPSGNRLETTVSIKALKKSFGGKDAVFVKGILDGLRRVGAICAWRLDGKNFSLTYKNDQVKKCLTKAGQALELKIYTAAMSVRDGDGSPIYNDAETGVIIDWDGKEEKYDAENEIDVMLMRGLVPVFISCKNGHVAVDELYKLDVVAKRFGGMYAKKALVATALDSSSESARYLAARAESMGIKLILDMQRLNDAELKKTVGSLWED